MGERERESAQVIIWVIVCEVVVHFIFLFISKFRDVGLCEITLNKFCSNCFTIWLTSNLVSLFFVQISKVTSRDRKSEKTEPQGVQK